MAIIIVTSVKAFIIPSCFLIPAIFSSNTSLFLFICSNLFLPSLNNNISFIPFKDSNKCEFVLANSALYSTPASLPNLDDITGIKYPTIM